MSEVDYGQSAEDHQSLLVLVKQTGNRISPKKFNKTWERIKKLSCVAIPGQTRSAWVKYRRGYPRENNEWGDFQAHRKTLGLISVGECSNAREFEELFDSYKKVKDEYSETLYNSRLIVFGMNRDGSALDQGTSSSGHVAPDEKKADVNPTKVSKDALKEANGEEQSEEGGAMKSSMHSEDSGVAADISPSSDTTSITDGSDQKALSPSDKSLDGGQITFMSSKSKRTPKKEQSKAEDSVGKDNRNKLIKRPLTSSVSDSRAKDNTGAEVIFYPNDNDINDLDEKIREFITSLFFVLEGKRLDRSFERQDRMQLLCAPFEKKDYVGLDTDTKSFRKKCQGRLRKHLADLCLQAGLPGEAILHYETAMDILRPINDLFWIGGCVEGLCSASVIVTYPRHNAPALRRNLSLSTKRGSSMMNEAKLRTGSIKHSYSNGLDDLGSKEDKLGTAALNPEDVIEKYKEVLAFYSKFRNAGIIEMEASLKACRILIRQSKYLQASDFLQNVIYINLRISDEDTINRYCTLSQLYNDIGFRRKGAFFQRIAAMQSVSPQNPKHNWSQCYNLLLQALEGYSISFETGAHEEDEGWPVLQARVLNELIFSARKMGNVAVAVRHTTFLLHLLQQHLSSTELKEITGTLEQLTSRCEGIPQSLVLDNGTILPPVALTNIPSVVSFKLMQLRPHLEPTKLDSKTEKVDTGPFIFTPLSLGQTTPEETVNKVDFSWVAGDLCEVQLTVINPLPGELKITHMALIAEGVEMECYPTNPIIPAESGPYLVKILSRPKSSGELTLTGYTTHVFGVKNICKLKDLPKLDMREVVVSVAPELPQIQLTTSLPKAATFTSGQDSACVVTSATAVLYAGESKECLVTIQNTSSQPVQQLAVHVNCKPAEKEFFQKLFTWNEDNILSQLPVQSNGVMCFSVCLYGLSDFLSHDQIPNQEGQEPKCVESLLRLDYSGGPGLEASHCRRCAINFSVDIHPSVIFHSWDSLPAESCDHCYLVLDLKNVSGRELQLVYNNNQTLVFTSNQIRRIAVLLERCIFPPDRDSENMDYNQSRSLDLQPVNHYSAYLDSLVDIQWSIPSEKVQGKVSLAHLTWTESQLQQIRVSDVSWDVKVNDESYILKRSPSVAIGNLVNIDVKVTLKPDVNTDSALLSVGCSQCKQEGSVLDNWTVVGSNSRQFNMVQKEEVLQLETSFIFHCAGNYRVDLMCTLRTVSEQSECRVFKYHPIDIQATDEVIV